MANTYAPSTAFRDDVEGRVGAYFTDTGLARRDSPRMYVKTLVLMLWLAASYGALVFWAHAWWQALPLALSLSLAMAGVGFNVQHDGNHQAYSRHGWVNSAMALTLNLLGGNDHFWRFKHNIAHHTFPNIAGLDDDIYIGPLGRLSPHDRRFWFHRAQHLYIWLVYALLVVEWHLSGDFRSMVKPGIGQTHVPRPRGWGQVSFWGGKLLFAVLAFGIPLSRHSVGSVVVIYLFTTVMLGLTLATVFQLAHCVEEAVFRQPAPGTRRIASEWSAHQVESSVDFARGNRLLTWYLGGLNFQIEHHLFPKICHVHYPAIAKIVEKVCAEHGVRHFSHPTAGAALRSHVRLLRRLGRRPDDAAAPAAAA